MKKPLNRYALSRGLSWLASADPEELAGQAMQVIPEVTARRVGITGAPGVGKSTLTAHLARLRNGTERLGVLALDPSSPVSGGAILGDRVRMDGLDGNEQLYVRSIGSRRTNDGLADNLPEMLDLMDEHGFDEVLLETVGIGQAEHAVRHQVDTLILVLLPDSGDVVQAMKAGIIEMADIFVVNKSDLAGAQRMAADINRIAALSKLDNEAWKPPVVLTSEKEPESFSILSRHIDDHQAWLKGQPQLKSLMRARYRLRRIIERRLMLYLEEQGDDFYEKKLDCQVSTALHAIS